jgi:hypothetical protein
MIYNVRVLLLEHNNIRQAYGLFPSNPDRDLSAREVMAVEVPMHFLRLCCYIQADPFLHRLTPVSLI